MLHWCFAQLQITNYELPEEADANLLSNLGEEVEMKTFKTNVPPTLECDKDQALIIKIICLGGYMFGVGRKGELIKDYLQVTQPARIGYYPPLLIGCDFHVKTIKCKKGDDHNPSRRKFMCQSRQTNKHGR